MSLISLENIKENANKKVLFEEKTIGSCYQKDIGKMLSLDDISSTQKLRIIEETLKRNPTLVYSYVENIVTLLYLVYLSKFRFI